MKHTISEIIGRDIISSIYSEGLLIKNMIERIFPECDFTGYEIIEENGLELIEEQVLYNELLINNQEFRNMIIENIDYYKEFGFIMDDDFINKVYILASEYENYIEEMVDIGTLEIDNCFDYAPEIVTELKKYDKRKQKENKRIIKFNFQNNK